MYFSYGARFEFLRTMFARSYTMRGEIDLQSYLAPYECFQWDVDAVEDAQSVLDVLQSLPDVPLPGLAHFVWQLPSMM